MCSRVTCTGVLQTQHGESELRKRSRLYCISKKASCSKATDGFTHSDVETRRAARNKVSRDKQVASKNLESVFFFRKVYEGVREEWWRTVRKNEQPSTPRWPLWPQHSHHCLRPRKSKSGQSVSSSRLLKPRPCEQTLYFRTDKVVSQRCWRVQREGNTRWEG